MKSARAELFDTAQKIGPNNGHFKRMKLVTADPPAPSRSRVAPTLIDPPTPRAAGAEPVIAPNAPTARPRGAWRTGELLGVGALAVAGVGALAAVVWGIASSTSPGDSPRPTPSPARRADAAPAKAKKS